MRRSWLRWLTAALLAGGVALFIMHGGMGGGEDQKEAPAPVHDMEARGVHMTQRGEGGLWELFAARAVHNQRREVIRMEVVRVLLPRTEGEPVEITANQATIRDSDRRVTLTGDVVLRHPEGYRMRTDYLHYWPEEARGTTEARVRLDAPFGQAEARGATFWTQRRELRLHQSVRTTVTEQLGDDR
jgi:LPS export ABC transporter protein LptC